MAFFDANEIAEFEELADAKLDQIATITRMVTVVGEGSSRKQVPTTIPDIPCSVAPMRIVGTENVIADQIQGQAPFKIRFHRDADIRSGDTATVEGIRYTLLPSDKGRGYSPFLIFPATKN